MLPPSPLSPRNQATSVWTGREWIVWGGYDRLAPETARVTATGAAFDPAHRKWRMLAASPLSPRAGAMSVWTGKEMLVLGGYPAVRTDSMANFQDGAAYDSGHDRWRRLPALPAVAGHQRYDPVAVWAGTRLLVWWPWANVQHFGNTTTGTVGYDLFRYDPGLDHWELLPADPAAPDGIGNPIWTGRDVIVPGTPPFRGPFSGPATLSLPAHRYDPVTNRWTPVPNGPDRYGVSVWTGSALLVVSERQTAPQCAKPGPCEEPPSVEGTLSAWDPSSGTWKDLPPLPLPNGPTLPNDVTAFWTGRELLSWGTVFAYQPQTTAKPDAEGSLVPVVRGLRFGT